MQRPGVCWCEGWGIHCRMAHGSQQHGWQHGSQPRPLQPRPFYINGTCRVKTRQEWAPAVNEMSCPGLAKQQYKVLWACYQSACSQMMPVSCNLALLDGPSQPLDALTAAIAARSCRCCQTNAQKSSRWCRCGDSAPRSVPCHPAPCLHSRWHR